MSGNAFARHGSSTMRVAVLEAAHVELADGRAAVRSVRHAVDEEPAGAADALAAVRVERDRILALRDQPFVDDVEHLEEGHVGRDVLGRVVDEPPRAFGPGLPPDFQMDAHAVAVSLQLSMPVLSCELH